MSFEDFISNINENELKRLNEEFYRRKNTIPTYQYSKIKDVDLRKLVDIERKIDRDIFSDWFSFDVKFDDDILEFLNNLINENIDLISNYKEEDLKIYVIAPLLNRVNFKMIDYEIRGFYEEKITYKTDKFIFNGTTDFVVSKGLFEIKKPYFFIQEFKRAEEFSNPRPQLLAELISAVELNDWEYIRGAYIVGGIWNFVILKRLETNRYEYFISQNFDSTKISDLKSIYRNLLFVKNEIMSFV